MEVRDLVAVLWLPLRQLWKVCNNPVLQTKQNKRHSGLPTPLHLLFVTNRYVAGWGVCVETESLHPPSGNWADNLVNSGLAHCDQMKAKIILS